MHQNILSCSFVQLHRIHKHLGLYCYSQNNLDTGKQQRSNSHNPSYLQQASVFDSILRLALHYLLIVWCFRNLSMLGQFKVVLAIQVICVWSCHNKTRLDFVSQNGGLQSISCGCQRLSTGGSGAEWSPWPEDKEILLYWSSSVSGIPRMNWSSSVSGIHRKIFSAWPNEENLTV